MAWPIKKNVAVTIGFSIVDADGDPVPTATNLDSEISKDGVAFVDCTNEAQNIQSSAVDTGIYSLLLEAGETNADLIIIMVKTDFAGAKTTVLVFYPTTRGIDDLAHPTVPGRSIDVATTGEVGVDLDNPLGALGTPQFDANFLADSLVATDMDTYQGKVVIIDDEAATTDRYTVVFMKNGQPVTTGITVPTIQVIKATDGTDLVASIALVEIGSTGLYRHNATAGDRIVNGAAYMVKVEATIDGATRTWYQSIGRDST